MPKFETPKSAEMDFKRQLVRLAKTVGAIVQTYIVDGKISDPDAMVQALRQYSRTVGFWAQSLTSAMIERVSKANLRSWSGISIDLRKTIEQTPIGATAQALQQEQVALIQSIPIEAAERAQKLALEAVISGDRAEEIAQELMRTTQVTESRAKLIARTEVARTNAVITQARSQYVGATHYIWRTARDASVRDTHKKLEGKVFSFADPPEIPNEGRHGPGEFPNCRCYAEPIIDV